MSFVVNPKLKSHLLSRQKSIARKKKFRALLRTIKKIPFHCDHMYLRAKTTEILDLWVLNPERLRKKAQTQIWIWQKRLRRLRRQIQEKPFRVRFFHHWTQELPFPTRKESLVNALADRYKNLRFKDRRDFLRTYIGQMLLSTQVYSRRFSKNTWYRRSVWWWKHAEENDDYDNEPQSWGQTRSFFAKIQQKSWWYETLVQKRVPIQNAKRFVLDRPETAFQFHWKQRIQEPWKEILLFRRALYSGFVENVRKANKERPLEMKVYLRYKNPRSEKKNRLYKRITMLLANYRYNCRILAKKHARIQQLVRKIVWPFYGHLRTKQMYKIYQKSRRVKSHVLTRNEIILSHFESRLDVVVYRLNFAPTILWARRLIQSGAIFIASANNTTPWERMHASLKKIAFPLKLRDPQKLYCTTLWKYPRRWKKGERKKIPAGSRHWATFRFLSCAQKKISYLLQPGDVVQCLSGNSLHQLKTKTLLYQKPIPTHLLTKKEVTFVFQKRLQSLIHRTYNASEEPAEVLNTAVFLHAPRFGDLNARDRIQESFFRWTIW